MEQERRQRLASEGRSAGRKLTLLGGGRQCSSRGCGRWCHWECHLGAGVKTREDQTANKAKPRQGGLTAMGNRFLESRGSSETL